jgi:serine/threonine protein kinase
MSSGWQVGATVDKEFRIEAELGRGGMGTVYLVRNGGTGARYALKKADVRDHSTQRLFEKELETWIGLPKNQNLIQCHFFRTLPDGIAIYAEYAPGGTLAEWIENERITKFPHVLDLGIQFAWGLYVAHKHGVIHRDVKPLNALMTEDGTLKVSDFGISHRSDAGSSRHATDGQGRQLCTVEYAAHEQFEGTIGTEKSDMWSWALTFIEMLVVDRFWPVGRDGVGILERALERADDSILPSAYRQSVEVVLRRCLAPDPNDRFNDMGVVCEALKQLYQNCVGHVYLRPLELPHAAVASSESEEPIHELTGSQLSDPIHWLREALRESGRDPREADAYQNRTSGSRKSKIATHLGIFNEAARLYEELIQSGRTDLEVDVARMYRQKAINHEGANDMAGALTNYERSIALSEKAVLSNKQPQHAVELAHAYGDKGVATRMSGDLAGAITLYDKALAIMRPLATHGHELSLFTTLLLNKGVAVDTAGRSREAVEIYDECIPILERLSRGGNNTTHTGALTRAYMNKSVAVCLLHDYQQAADLCAKTIAIYEDLLERPGQEHMQFELARTLGNHAEALAKLGKGKEALTESERAVGILKEQVEHAQRHDLLLDLGHAYLRKVGLLDARRDRRRQEEALERAISVLENAVVNYGYTEGKSALTRARTLRERGQ